MSPLTIKNAARTYGVSESVLRKWIARGILPSDLVILRGKQIHLLDRDVLERVLNERNMTSDSAIRASTYQPVEDIAATFDAMQRQIDDLAQRVQHLEAAQKPLTAFPDSTPTHKQRTPPASSYAYKTPTGRPTPIPAGYVSWYAFRHGMSDGSMGRWKAEHPELVHRGKWNNETGQSVKVILSPEGQRAYLEWARTQKKFEECADCPHE